MGKFNFVKKLSALFGMHDKKDDEFFEELTDTLIEGDIGAKTAFEITEKLEKICKEKKLTEQADIQNALAELLLSDIKTIELKPEPNKTSLYMLLGVNGAGKTTSAAKLASFYSKQGTSVVLAAADTFRAAAIEQLTFHAQKVGVRIVAHQHGADPSAVVFDAASAANNQDATNGSLVIADTAGRLHNKENLVRELQKIDRISAQKASDGCYKKILVLDATTGQNAIRQAEVFNDAVGVDAVILTKYDSTAKGGIVITLGKELGIPVAFVCTGEHYEDIAPFYADQFVKDFLES